MKRSILAGCRYAGGGLASIDAIAGVTAYPCCSRGGPTWSRMSLDSPAVRVAVFAVQGGSSWELRLPWRSLEELEARRDPKMIEVVPRPGAPGPSPTAL